jgi:anti-sigma regulatory factor (Ser/Thr protein kinase)
MDNTPFTSYLIEDRSFVSYIKREIHNLVKDNFSSQRTGEIDIIVSELASNIIKHAKKGELLYRFFKAKDNPVFEVIALDNGPGIKDLHLMMKDGASSTNTLGQGLGAIKRLSNFSQIYSPTNAGTITYCQICSEDQDDLPEELEKKILIRAISIAKPGEKECGDGYCIKKEGTRIKLIMGDGLGHGPLAQLAAKTAIVSFNNNIKENDPVDILKAIHNDVKKTRGLVATVVILDTKEKNIKLCGIGNIACRLYNGIVLKSNMSYNGIVGLNIPNTINHTSTPLEKNQTLILCSDGITSRWDLSKYTFILKYDPIIMAAIIYRDHGRKTDDMSILIAKVK